MLIYTLLGLVSGLLIGSWGVYWLLNRKDQPVTSYFANPNVTFSNAKREKPDAEAQEAARKAAEDSEKALQGLMNMFTYDGTPQKKDGDR
jgi:hypothetical protein